MAAGNRGFPAADAPVHAGRRASEIWRRAITSRGPRMSSPAKLTGILVAHSGKAEQLKALLVGMVPPSRAEPGNLRYDVWQDEAQADRFITDELYKDDTAISAHHQSPHYKDYLSRIPDLADRTALVLTPIAVEEAR